MLIRKKGGSHRFCVDYWGLNEVTRSGTFPLPRIGGLLDQLGGARFFSTLGLASGFWQIRVHPGSQPKTAFITHHGLHGFRVMPFGLEDTPAASQRLVHWVVADLDPAEGPGFISAYIGGVLVFSWTLQEHLQSWRPWPWCGPSCTSGAIYMGRK